MNNMVTCPCCNGTGWESSTSTCRMCSTTLVVTEKEADEYYEAMQREEEKYYKSLDENKSET